MRKFLALIFLCFSLFLFSQEGNKNGTIKIAPSPCKDIQLTIGGILKHDTLSYSELNEQGGFVAVVINCNTTASYKILHYQLYINESKPILKNGAHCHWNEFFPKNQNGKIEVRNCLVECAVKGKPTEVITLADHIFYILSDKEGQ